MYKLRQKTRLSGFSRRFTRSSARYRLRQPPVGLGAGTVLCVLLSLVIVACVSVPDAYRTIGQRGWDSAGQQTDSCASYPLATLPDDVSAPTSVLDAQGFDLMNWNMLKGQRQGWDEDFLLLGKHRDLLTIQEAYLTDALRNQLNSGQFNWDLAPAFTYRGTASGVLTASKIKPEVLCMLRVVEPLIRIPKSMLLTRYPFSQSGKWLLVANIHGINFTVGTDHFRDHWQQFEKLLAAYTGPLILAGDFNTWNDERAAIVRAATRRMGLKSVAFDSKKRSTVFGHPLDHVYYRGLVPTATAVHEVETSDHNPMVITFKLAGAKG